MTEQSKAQRLADYLETTSEIKSQKYGTDWDNIHDAAAELRRLDQSEREGWRYADELEQERKRLTALVGELVEALEEAHDLCLDAYCSQAREVIVHALNKAKEQT